MNYVQLLAEATQIFMRNKNSLILSGKHGFFQTIEKVP